LASVNQLHPEHLADLRLSGLTDATIEAAGLYAESDATIIGKQLNWKGPARVLVPALAIPFVAADGKSNGYIRFKPLTPMPDRKTGKPRKYLSPIGKSNRAYTPAGTRGSLSDSTIPLLITEGEKKALKADQEGFACLGLVGVYGWHKARQKNADGRGEGPRELIADMSAVDWQGRSVFIVFDSDATSNENVVWAEWHLSKALAEKGANVRVVRLPSGPDGSKCGHDDFLVAPGSEKLHGLLASAGTAQRPVSKHDDSAAPETEFALAEELIRRHGQDLRYCGQLKAWFVWDGIRWAEDVTGQAQERSKATSKAIYHEALSEHIALTEKVKGGDDEVKKKFEKQIATVKDRLAWARKSQTRDKVAACLAIASTAPGIAIRTADLDRDPWLLNCNNGTIDLRTGQLRDHNRNDLITKLAPADFDQNAKAPTFEKFLADVFPATGDAAEVPGNEQLIGFVQRALGYAITGTVTEHVLLVFHGVGSNGKTCLLEAILFALGDYGMSAAPTLLMAKQHQDHPTELADLFGRRLVVTSETKAGGYLDEALVKWLTGGDTIRARRMKENFWEFKPTHQVILSTNHRPKLHNPNDDAMKRRLRLVPFAVKFWNPAEPAEPGEERPENRKRDPKLLERLKAEASGIVAWLVRGSLSWQEIGLGAVGEVTAATREYFDSEDVIADFLAERCKLHPDCKAKASSLYAAFSEWGKASGEYVVNSREFGRRLGLRAGVERYTNNGTWYRGVGLLEADV